jgi:hypothetical protein
MRFVFILISLQIYHSVNGQSLKSLNLNGHYGFIFVHSKDVENTAGSRPIGLSVEYSKLKFDSISFNYARCYPKTGFGLVYFNYDNHVLGHSVSTNYFIEPNILISKRTMFAPRGSVGLSFLTNPYHHIKNPNNNSYSLPISVFLQVGLITNHQLSKRIGLNLSANYLHISNGGIKDPNKGINWMSACIGVGYKLNNDEFKKQTYSTEIRTQKINRFEIGLYSSSKIVSKGEKQRYFVPGIFTAYHKQLNNLHSIGLFADLHFDYSLAEKQNRTNEALHYHFASLAIDHSFLMGRFKFWQQAGYYFLEPDERFIKWYHRWGLNYQITKHIALGGSVKAHLHVAHFADLRISYSFPINKNRSLNYVRPE